jgi:hypothetical protein
MGFSDFRFHAEANLFTSVAFSNGWQQFKKSYLPLVLLEQPFFHDLVLCSFHSPFTSACWATWLPAWIDKICMHDDDKTCMQSSY